MPEAGTAGPGSMVRDHSGYVDIDSSPDPSIYVDRLDSMRRNSFWRRVKQESFRFLELHNGLKVLDVGCGTGDDVQDIARQVSPDGLCIGLDRSVAMITEARFRHDTRLPAEFHVGDVCDLKFETNTFDRCRSERLLQHLDSPSQAVREMVRVLKRGGRMVAVEPDYGSLRIEGADRTITEKILQHRRAHFRASRIGRLLPTLFLDSGLGQLSVSVRILSTTTLIGEEHQRVHRYAESAHQDGFISVVELKAWLSELQYAAESGNYRQALATFLVEGVKQ